MKPQISDLAKLRHKLEDLHIGNHPDALDIAWPHIDHPDRFIRWAALMAIQRLPVEKWAEKALTEKNQGKRAYVLLSCQGCRDRSISPQKIDPPINRKMGNKILQSLLKIDFEKLSPAEQLSMVRTYQVAMVRFGKPSKQTADQIIAQLDVHFPAKTYEMNWLLCETLAFLEAPNVAKKGISLLQKATTQEEQMEYARSLRNLKTGWTNELRSQYFNWFLKAANYRGGASFTKFIEFIRNDAVASLTKAEKKELAPLLAKKAEVKSPAEVMAEAMAGRTFVKNWELEELSKISSSGLKERDFENGRKMFAAGGCFACHRFGNEGGMNGPDLSGSPHGTNHVSRLMISLSKSFILAKKSNQRTNLFRLSVTLKKEDGDALT